MAAVLLSVRHCQLIPFLVPRSFRPVVSLFASNICRAFPSFKIYSWPGMGRVVLRAGGLFALDSSNVRPVCQSIASSMRHRSTRTAFFFSFFWPRCILTDGQLWHSWTCFPSFTYMKIFDDISRRSRAAGWWENRVERPLLVDITEAALGSPAAIHPYRRMRRVFSIREPV